MKRYNAFLLGVLVTVLASTLFWAGTAYATTGCFTDTNGYWAETFVCWLKDNGISGGYPDGTFKPDNYITRAEMAVMLQKVANVPPSSGLIRINSGPNSWDFFGNQPGPLTVFRYDEYIGITNPAANTTHVFVMTPTFPSALYGRNLSVTGVEYCYTASPNAFVNYVTTWFDNETSGASASPSINIVFDDTDRTDAACRYYNITPRAVDDNTVLGVFVGITWGPSGAGAQLRLGRVTFYFQPTDTLVVAPMGINAEEAPDVPDLPKPIPNE